MMARRVLVVDDDRASLPALSKNQGRHGGRPRSGRVETRPFNLYQIPPSARRAKIRDLHVRGR